MSHDMRLKNARHRLDAVLDDLPADAVHYIATMIHNMTDTLIEVHRAGLRAGKGEGEQPEQGDKDEEARGSPYTVPHSQNKKLT